ncbi:MAG: EamA family transporter [Patescibacteria group bacterium]
MLKWILPLSILVLFEGIADIFAKNWSLKGGYWLAALSLTSYLLANTFWLFALRSGSGLGKGAIIFSVSSAIIAVVLGLLFYHEEITKFQIAGMVLGIVSLIFIFWE